jgi:hypothetical protein
MIQANPEQRPRIAKICDYFSNCNVDITIFSPEKFLGKGGEGIVYRSNYKMAAVAVKRLELFRIKKDDESKKEQTVMQQLNHVNVLKLFHWEDKGDFRYLMKIIL